MHELNALEIGNALVKQNHVSQADLDSVIDEVNAGKPFDALLFKRKLVEETQFYKTLADVHSLSYVDLSDYRIDPKIMDIISSSLAKDHIVLPLFKIRENLSVVMADPTDVIALDLIRDETGCEPEPMVSTRSEIEGIIEHYYGAGHSMGELVDTLRKKDQKKDDLIYGELATAEAEQPVIKLVNLLIEHAVGVKASDIHIEPDIDALRVRLRIDGILHEVTAPPKKYEHAIISRVKIMSDLNIAENRIPQDGRFSINVGKKKIDIRVSIVPTVNGENMILRILDASMLECELDDLGLFPDSRKKFENMIRQPYGMILVTGPTGSGKTTTLYTALRTINSPEINLITIEDPVEYRLNMIRQIQVNPVVGLTFATGLRSIVRQDPDVIMVGEIRDFETAEIAIQSALTGHLVFSTLHTNDAAGAPVRLIEMGIEPFLVTSSVIGVVAQRLVRKICAKCKKVDPLPETVLTQYGLVGQKMFKGKGCTTCHQTGFVGRLGIYEVFLLNKELRELIVNKRPAAEVSQAAQAAGMQIMLEDGLEKVKQGITTLDEVLRVAKGVE